jgi:hypothetical protein
MDLVFAETIAVSAMRTALPAGLMIKETFAQCSVAGFDQDQVQTGDGAVAFTKRLGNMT